MFTNSLALMEVEILPFFREIEANSRKQLLKKS
jgi:hypothetical protein